MTLSVAEVVQVLSDSGIVSSGRLEQYVPPKSEYHTAEALLKRLNEEKLLTPYQSNEVLAGRAKSLVLGGYVILDVIGAGGMGQVFKAEHCRMRRVVAIKTLPPDLLNDPSAVSRFLREIQAAAKLRHRNIVATDDSAEIDGVHFLVMEYIDGEDLSKLITKSGPMSVSQALDVIHQAACGLDYAHKKGVIHRDIKPANVLLDSEGTVKILDMGLARFDAQIASSETNNPLTQAGDVFGTVDFMSPEQAVNTKNADARADIYSLGCTLYYLLTAEMPYRGNTVVEKILAHREHPIPSIRQLRPDVSAAVDAIFSRMVAKHADERQQSMMELMAELQKLETSSNSMMAIPSREPRRPAQPSPVHWREHASRSTKNRTQHYLSAYITAAIVGSILLVTCTFLLINRSRVAPTENESDGTPVASRESDTVPDFADGTNAPPTDPPVSVADTENNKQLVSDENKPAEAPIAKSEEQQVGSTVTETSTFEIAPEVKPSDEPKKDDAPSAAAQLFASFAKQLKTLNPEIDGDMSHETVDGKIRKFSIHSEQLVDVSPITQLSDLQDLNLDGCSQLADLSPLHGILLTKLSCNSTAVSDLGPLKDMPLTSLHCSGTPLTDLETIKDLPLKDLVISFSEVEDLSPLETVPLTKLDCRNTRVSDVTPLRGLNLTSLSFSPALISEGIEVLREIQSLEVISVGVAHYSPQEFWPKYDSNEIEHPALRKSSNSDGEADGKMARKSSEDKPAPPIDSPSPSEPKPTEIEPTLPPSILTFPADQAAITASQNAWAEYLKQGVAVENSLGMRMIVVPPGEYTIGTDPNDARRPTHAINSQNAKVNSVFRIASTEVTRGQWSRIMNSRPWESHETGAKRNDHDLPANWLNWKEATDFCDKLTKTELDEGKISSSSTYRLPTECEWEWACRAGTAGQFVCQNNDVAKYAWHNQLDNHAPQGVALLNANAYGLHDMHGNIAEWCLDNFLESSQFDRADSQESKVSNKAILRGGNFKRTAKHCASAARDPMLKESRTSETGLRVVQVYQP